MAEYLISKKSHSVAIKILQKDDKAHKTFLILNETSFRKVIGVAIVNKLIK